MSVEPSESLATRAHFLTLPAHEQRAAIARLAAAGHGDHTIAAATGLSVEMVRRVLGERAAASVGKRGGA